MAANKQGGNQGGKQSGDTSNRGFASMDPQKQREIASEGGRAAHASGHAHEFTSEEARRAGAMSHKNDASRQGSAGASQQSGDTGHRGFESMDPQKQRDIASEGGRAAHASGHAHEFTPEEARRAGAQSHKNDNKR